MVLHAKKATESAKRFAVDLVYPKRCAGCGRRGTWLCLQCDAMLPRFEPPACVRCGVPVLLSCHCGELPDSLAFVRSVGPFSGWLKDAIVLFKYHGEWGRAEQLGTMLAAAVAGGEAVSGLVPVPLHLARQRRRGFNQSLFLARAVADVLQVPVIEALRRTRRTEAQVHLGASERMHNVEEAFAVRDNVDVADATFMLIDDVITTGATLGACADVLLAAGAAHVSAATVAREL